LRMVAGLEAINNGFLSVHVFRQERRLDMRAPVLLDWVGILASLATTLTWALIDPSVWALACGPLVGGVSKTTPRMISLDDKRLLTIWQTLQNNSAQIHVREVGILR